MRRLRHPPRPPAPFHPVMFLAAETVLLDLTQSWTPPPSPWSVGRYGEDRGIYTADLFDGDGGRRTVHLGVDLGGPAGVAVHAPTSGRVVYAGYNPAEGDYGYTLVTRHGTPVEALGPTWYLLLGHLSAASVVRSPIGRTVAAGEVLGWLGDATENGGWPPHVHVQVSGVDPGTHDMPGACSRADRVRMQGRYPDPACIIGAFVPADPVG